MSKRWVVKIGSALLTADGRGLDVSSIASWVEQLVELRKEGMEIILVSSGAVAEGMSRLNVSKRPQTLHELQAIAAVGQMGLIQAYESQFQKYQLATAQVLLTHDDLSNRTRYLNARSTLLTLLDLGVIPVVNENDTVVTDEIRFGDNDTLAALVANLVEAEQLVILTDRDGLYDADPVKNPNAKLVREAKASDPMLEKVASGSNSGLGRGGMITKVGAAQLAARSGTTTVIAGGRNKNVIKRIFEGSIECTTLLPEEEPMAARKQWLAGHLQMRGELVLDDGAVKVLKRSGSSLLPVGVKEVKGSFNRGDMVACFSVEGEKIACGLVNYNSEDARKIAGTRSEDIEKVLGFVDEEELIHRDNLVLL